MAMEKQEWKNGLKPGEGDSERKAEAVYVEGEVFYTYPSSMPAEKTCAGADDD